MIAQLEDGVRRAKSRLSQGIHPPYGGFLFGRKRPPSDAAEECAELDDLSRRRASLIRDRSNLERHRDHYDEGVFTALSSEVYPLPASRTASAHNLPHRARQRRFGASPHAFHSGRSCRQFCARLLSLTAAARDRGGAERRDRGAAGRPPGGDSRCRAARPTVWELAAKADSAAALRLRATTIWVARYGWRQSIARCDAVLPLPGRLRRPLGRSAAGEPGAARERERHTTMYFGATPAHTVRAPQWPRNACRLSRLDSSC